MRSDSMPLDDPLRNALRGALVEVGCPAEVAQEIAANARIADELVMIDTPAFRRGVEYPSDLEDIDPAMQILAMQVANDNAEATDRAGRGEPGWVAFWPLPDRKPRQG
ncbi:hypothetical protein ACWKWC_12130 [Geodermatophilus nigrescens]